MQCIHMMLESNANNTNNGTNSNNENDKDFRNIYITAIFINYTNSHFYSIDIKPFGVISQSGAAIIILLY